MRRREFIGVLVAALVVPVPARADQTAMPVIGLLGAATPDDAEVARNIAAFRRGLAEMGYVEGHTVHIDYLWADGHYDRLPALAAELVARRVDVIVNEGGGPSLLAAKNATATIPIVFHTGTDPVADGLVQSLAHPGGNLTGVNLLNTDLAPKLLQLLAELVPHAKTVALLVNPSSSYATLYQRNAQAFADSRDMRLRVLKADNEGEIDVAFATLDRASADAILVGGDTFYTTRRDQIIAQAANHAIPAIYPQSLFARAGGLIAYGPSLPAAYRIKGHYTAKILSGEKPADLPVQEPTMLELVVNLKTAAALGLTVPTSILARADEVIE
jgi:putative ABC transport system substrate-binding protein